jgi:hypothetical protein
VKGDESRVDRECSGLRWKAGKEYAGSGEPPARRFARIRMSEKSQSAPGSGDVLLDMEE